MTTFRGQFPKNKAFLPVIHLQTPSQAKMNARIARDEGADGIWLIGHGWKPQQTIDVYQEVRGAYPEQWIGLNLLTRTANQAQLFMPDSVDGMWVDDAGVDERNPGDIAATAERNWDERQTTLFTCMGLYFGGMAFKYCPVVRDLAAVAKAVAPFVDVVTTSGDTTGSPPSVEKIRIIREAIGPKKPLAIASGLSAENVKPFVDLGGPLACLAASSITDPETELLISSKVKAFRAAFYS